MLRIRTLMTMLTHINLRKGNTLFIIGAAIHILSLGINHKMRFAICNHQLEITESCIQHSPMSGEANTARILKVSTMVCSPKFTRSCSESKEHILRIPLHPLRLNRTVGLVHNIVSEG